jgi:hypothetical protein
MTMGRFCVMVMLLAARAAAAEDELDIPGIDATDLRGDALVWEDASFYVEPLDPTSAIKFPQYARRNEDGRAIPVRIVDSSSKTYVEIELPNRADCTWRRIEPDKRIDGLHLFVKREDLAPVLVKPFAQQWPDGTRVKLGIGTPVIPTAAGDYLAPARADHFHVQIPHGSVGYVYKAGKIAEPETPPGKLVRIDAGVNARIGDENFNLRTMYWFGPTPDKKTDVAQVKLASRCLEMVVEVPSTSLRPGEPPPPPKQPITVSATGRELHIPVGAPLSTPGGREIAVASQPIAVTAPTADTACFEATLRYVKEDQTYGSIPKNIKLCAPASLLER